MIHLDENVPSPTPLLPLHCVGERHVLKMCMKHLGLPFQTVMSLGNWPRSAPVSVQRFECQAYVLVATGNAADAE